MVGIVPHEAMGEGSVAAPFEEAGVDAPVEAMEPTEPTVVSSASDVAIATDCRIVESGAPSEEAAQPAQPAQPSSVPPAEPSPHPPSPKHLSDSLMHEGENVAALAVSELLSPEEYCMQLLSASIVQPLTASDASCGEPPLKPAAVDSPHTAWCSTPRRLGLLAFLPPDEGFASYAAKPTGECGACIDGDGDNGAGEIGELDLSWWGWGWGLERSEWGRPLALVGLLLVSHAAAFLLGVVMGRHHQALAQSGEAVLFRRFSSSSAPTLARFSWL
jgi:hypothetical protein